MSHGSVRELSLTVESRALPLFFPLLQDGFMLEARVGASIREFLQDRCRLARNSIENRIRTLFLDGMPVDDLDGVIIENNSTLALSGAMPGLVGAVMRSDSPLRSFRRSITHGVGTSTNMKHQQQQLGLVRLKLFNTVMSEFGPHFLSLGILLEPVVLKDFLAELSDSQRRGIGEMLVDNEPVDESLLPRDALSGTRLVSLSVRTAG